MMRSGIARSARRSMPYASIGMIANGSVCFATISEADSDIIVPHKYIYIYLIIRKYIHDTNQVIFTVI